MSGDHVTRPEFENYMTFQKALDGNLKELVIEVKQTNVLLREDIASNQKILNAHISQYNLDKALAAKENIEINEKLSQIKSVVTERDGVYKMGKVLKIGGGIVLTGALMTLGGKIAGLI